MATFAKVFNDTVVKVIEVEDNFFDNFIDDSPGAWIETFKDASQRGKLAGIGDIYDTVNDEFRPPKPHNSWIWNAAAHKWTTPIEYPTDGNRYSWNEETESWDLQDPQ